MHERLLVLLDTMPGTVEMMPKAAPAAEPCNALTYPGDNPDLAWWLAASSGFQSGLAA
jgi:hypothetical protein